MLGTRYTIRKLFTYFSKRILATKLQQWWELFYLETPVVVLSPFFSVCFCCCLLFYHAEFMTLFLILLGLKQNPGCRSNSGVKYSCDNPSTSTRHIVKCNQQADFSIFSAFFLGIFFHSDSKLETNGYFIL